MHKLSLRLARYRSFGLRFLWVLTFAVNVFTLDLYRQTLIEDHNLLEQDFLGYYTAASLPRQTIYDINRQREFQTQLLGRPYRVPAGVLLYNHPPILVPVVKLLATEDYVVSYRRWAGVLSIVCVLCGGVVYFLLRTVRLSVSVCLLSSFSAVLFYPLYRNVEIGTDTPFVLLALLLWGFFLLRKWDFAAGFALAFTVIKPHFAIVMAAGTFAISRRAFVAFVLGAVLLTLSSVVYVGKKGTLDLFENIVITTSGEQLGVFFNRQYNFMGLLARFGFSKTVVGVAGWSALVAFMGFVALLRVPIALEKRLGLIVLGAVFFSPNLHFHDVSLLLLPLALIARGFVDCAPLAFFPITPAPFLGLGWTLSGYSTQAIAFVALIMRRTGFANRESLHVEDSRTNV